MKKKANLVLTFLFVTLILVVTTTTGLAQPDYTVMIANNPNIGSYLVDSQGNTLYYFTKDATGVSNCKGQCSVLWPTFYTDKIAVPSRLDAADFGMITREDGMKQTTFRGFPLYYFNKDMRAGDIKGEKVNDVWFVVSVN